MNRHPVAAGKSSFDLIDKDRLFSIFDLEKNKIHADLACGVGNYSLELAKRIKGEGKIHAFDLWREGIEELNKRILEQNIQCITAMVADITRVLPLNTGSVDSCLMATVIHDLSESERTTSIEEVVRVLKPQGFLMVVEFKKIDSGPGPSFQHRLSEDELDKIVSVHGLRNVFVGDVGPYNYFMKFVKEK